MARDNTRRETWRRKRNSSFGKFFSHQFIGTLNIKCTKSINSVRQAGQTSVGDVAKRDLRMDLLLAEHEAKNRKRKAAGQDPLPLPAALTGSSATPVAAIENGSTEEEDAASKRRKMLQEVLELDKDDDEEEEGDKAKDKGKGKASENDM